VLKMPRGAQVIYPKDLGPILMLADIFPGARVLESGVGSGALSMTLLRAGAVVTGYELRADFATGPDATSSRSSATPALERYHVEERDCYDGIDGDDFDRVVLDLPEPWQVVPHAQEALRPGGILVAYTPSITQASLRERLWPTVRSSSPRPSRCSSAAGTSRARRFVPITGWSATPAS
jgi:tRNA (adenine57-N1/adenine58-N1)-methyltransferase catalytic subunit